MESSFLFPGQLDFPKMLLSPCLVLPVLKPSQHHLLLMESLPCCHKGSWTQGMPLRLCSVCFLWKRVLADPHFPLFTLGKRPRNSCEGAEAVSQLLELRSESGL